jgi:hypothetical protein
MDTILQRKEAARYASPSLVLERGGACRVRCRVCG